MVKIYDDDTLDTESGSIVAIMLLQGDFDYIKRSGG